MDIALTIREIPFQVTWDEKTEKIKTSFAINEDSKLIEIKKKKFYVTSITDLLNRYKTIELRKYTLIKKDKINSK
jgi:hypothetical protein